MPTYEKYDGDGNMVERSVTFLGTPHDFQLSTISSMTDSPWRRVADVDDAPALAPMPAFAAPSEVDTAVDTPPADSPAVETSAPVDEVAPLDTALDTNEAAEPAATDEPAESGDHTEE